jgi:hypothetical protein
LRHNASDGVGSPFEKSNEGQRSRTEGRKIGQHVGKLGGGFISPFRPEQAPANGCLGAAMMPPRFTSLGDSFVAFL